MKNNRLAIASLITLALLNCGVVEAKIKTKSSTDINRTVLPIAQPRNPPITELDARKVKAPPVFQVKTPKDAPNVVIVLLDDMAFGTPTIFGGPIPMQTQDKLAQGGLRHNNFHTSTLCSPPRQVLKTGHNHHSGNTGGSAMETATTFPSYTGMLPNDVQTLAEILRLNRYSTGAFGKWHAPPWETSVSGPYGS